MSHPSLERRRLRPTARAETFAVLVDDLSFPAELTDITTDGFQARVDAVTFDEIRELIDGVRFGNTPPLPITMHWGLFDGRFGASFKDGPAARPIVERLIAEKTGTAALA